MVYKAAVRFGKRIVSLDVIFTYRWGLVFTNTEDGHAASRPKDTFHFTFSVPYTFTVPANPPLSELSFIDLIRLILAAGGRV